MSCGTIEWPHLTTPDVDSGAVCVGGEGGLWCMQGLAYVQPYLNKAVPVMLVCSFLGLGLCSEKA